MTVCIVMGVAGSGKSTVAEALARKCAAVYVDADDYHSAANRAKMASGEPLNDDDRWDWLSSLNLELRRLSVGHRVVFLACSALRESYRGWGFHQEDLGWMSVCLPRCNGNERSELRWESAHRGELGRPLGIHGRDAEHLGSGGRLLCARRAKAERQHGGLWARPWLGRTGCCSTARHEPATDHQMRDHRK